jgi:hypothetical protein
MPRADEADVICYALNEYGKPVDVEIVRGWIKGEGSPPPDLLVTWDAIIKELPYHVRTYKFAMMSAPDVSRNAHRRIAAMKEVDRKKKGMNEYGRAHGLKKTQPTLWLKPENQETLRTLARMLGVGQGALLSHWLNDAIEQMEAATRNIRAGRKRRRPPRQKRRPLSTPAMKRTVRYVEEIKKETRTDGA